jgi:hypothetical protein
MSRNTVISVCLLSVLHSLVLASTQEAPEYKHGEILVRFKSDKDKSKPFSSKQAIVRARGGKSIKKSFKRLSDLHVIKLPKEPQRRRRSKKIQGVKRHSVRRAELQNLSALDYSQRS